MSEREQVIDVVAVVNGLQDVLDNEEFVNQSSVDAITVAITMLKKQQPRVMTMEELSTWDGAFLIETKKGGIITWSTYHGEYEQSEDIICRLIDADGGMDYRIKRMYGHVWRCWAARPNREIRSNTPWES